MCGGTHTSAPCDAVAQGLSPRVRGNRLHRESRAVQTGSIPACAGEPHYRRPPRSPQAVYPRVCGGTTSADDDVVYCMGLSPRVRGNLWFLGSVAGFPGSIPACAGEPAAGAADSAAHTVYPRVCGGTSQSVARRRAVVGLSPRVRGNPTMQSRHKGRRGSIPACAGEPAAFWAIASSVVVYPRVCGGTCCGLAHCRQTSGLSPRVRGNLIGFVMPAQRAGSIPACAGEPGRCRHHTHI